MEQKKSLGKDFKKNIMDSVQTAKLKLFDVENKVSIKVKEYLENLSREELMELDDIHIGIGVHKGEIKVCINDNFKSVLASAKKEKGVIEIAKFFI